MAALTKVAAADGPGGHVGLYDVMRDPEGAADTLRRCGLYGVTVDCIVYDDGDCVMYDLTLAPWEATAAEGYPVEHVRIVIWSNGMIMAIPQDDGDRRWKHRQQDMWGDLCLWYPDDVPSLQWTWDDGLASYVTLVHRHVQAEEFWRRTGRWPAEDAPHGSGRHPIQTAAMADAAARWA